jgi:hypothetical protein
VKYVRQFLIQNILIDGAKTKEFFVEPQIEERASYLSKR